MVRYCWLTESRPGKFTPPTFGLWTGEATIFDDTFDTPDLAVAAAKSILAERHQRKDIPPTWKLYQVIYNEVAIYDK